MRHRLRRWLLTYWRSALVGGRQFTVTWDGRCDIRQIKALDIQEREVGSMVEMVEMVGPELVLIGLTSGRDALRSDNGVGGTGRGGGGEGSTLGG